MNAHGHKTNNGYFNTCFWWRFKQKVTLLSLYVLPYQDKEYTVNTNDVVVIDMDKIRVNMTRHSDIFTELVESVTIGTFDQPALIEETLISITTMFDEQFWENVQHDPTALAARRMNLFIALNTYPNWMCAIPSYSKFLRS